MKSRVLWAVAALLITVSSCVREDIPLPDPEPKPGERAEFSLENLTVRAYLNFLDMAPYRDGDYSYSIIDDYYQLSTTYRKDHPRPVSISWERDGGAQRLYVAENPEFETSISYPVGALAGSYELYNLIPGRQYWWKVVSGSTSATLGEGSFLTTGRRRFLKVDNICNVRDIGGIPVLDGSKRIKYGLVFRSGEMNGYHQDYDNRYCRINASGISALKTAGIKADLDLRTAEEAVNITVSPIGEDIDYIRFEEANTYYYDKFWESDVYVMAFQWMIDELRQGKPVLFHCIYGADRTGTLAFIVEALLGAGENQLAVDYELTSFSYGLNSPPRRRGPKNELSVYRYRQMVEGLLSAKFSGASLQEKIRGFLLSGGIPSEDLEWFVSYMLEDTDQ